VLVTHALAFTDLDGDVRVHQVLRGTHAAVVDAVDLGQFTAHDLLAREMGFDRGEMLSRWRAFLFVEGAADEAVLSELYGERLERARILVTPVHGHRNHAGLLEMQLLLRGTATPIAALFDGISEETIQRIRDDSGHREDMLKARDERATVAGIVKAEHRAGRAVEILTIGEADIFDLLDEDAIRAITPRRSFEGHETARRAFRDAGGGNTAKRKAFYRQRYGISMTPGTMRAIARGMRDRGLAVPTLEDRIDRVERLALAARHQR
jgi:hypothetical protein